MSNRSSSSLQWILSLLLLLKTASSSSSLSSAQPLAVAAALPSSSFPRCDESSEYLVEIEALPHVSKLPGYDSLDIVVKTLPSREQTPTTAINDDDETLSTNQSSSSSLSGYNLFPSFDEEEGANNNSKKYTKCIPKKECVRVQVKLFLLAGIDEPRYHLSDKDVIINQDGMKVPLSAAFPYIGDGSFVVAELGGSSCDVTCTEGTTLLEIEGHTDSLWLGWRLEETTTDEVLVQCFDSWTSDSSSCDLQGLMAEYFHPKICLPTDGCYRIVAGTSHKVSYGTTDHAASTFNVTFGGKRIATWEDIQFESLDFSSGSAASASCSNNHGPCTDPNESLMEFYLWRDTNRTWEQGNPDLDWELTTSNNSSLVAGGVVPKPVDLRKLTYERQCVLKDACYQLEISVPRTITIQEDFIRTIRPKTYHEEELYRVLLDGVIYNRNPEFTFGSDPYSGVPIEEQDPKFKEIVFLGECQPSQVCPQQEDSMLEITFSTGDRSTIRKNDGRGGWLPYSANWEIHDYQGGSVADKWYEVDSTFGSYTIGSDYRHYECVATKGTCLEFRVQQDAIESGSVQEKYSVKVDGLEQTERRNWDCEHNGYYYCHKSIVTSIGGDSCPSSQSLTPAAIACIVVVSVGAFAILVSFLVTRWLRDQNNLPTSGGTVKEEDDDDNEMAQSTTSPAPFEADHHESSESDPQIPVEVEVQAQATEDELYIRC